MAEANDTENPPEHQHSPPFSPLADTGAQIALLENFINCQLDLGNYQPDSYVQVSSNHLEALIQMIAKQVVNVHTAFRQELLTLNLPHTSDALAPLRLDVQQFEQQLQVLLDQVLTIRQQHGYLVTQLNHSAVDV